MRNLDYAKNVPTAKSAKNDHTLVKTIITNHVCIIQVATIYSAIFDMVIIYTLQVCRKFIILLCSQEENYFFHPWSSLEMRCISCLLQKLLLAEMGQRTRIFILETQWLPLLKCLATGWFASFVVTAWRCSSNLVFKDLPNVKHGKRCTRNGVWCGKQI